MDLKRYSEKPLKKEKNKINVCLFYFDDAAFYIRLISIFRNFKNSNRYNFFIVYPEDFDQFNKDVSNNLIFFDYIIIQRYWIDFEISRKLYEKSKKLNYKIIFEIDDDLMNMDKSNPGYSFFMEIKKDMEFMARNADVVTVSTDYLKDSIMPLNNNIIVIPNRLIDSWFIPKHNESHPDNIVKIGYMGSIYHSWDLNLIQEAITEVKRYFSNKNVDISFELIGGTSEELPFANRIVVPEDCQNYFKFVNWFRETVDWDIAIAPLEESNLNNAKSELKFLEYAVLKIPGIYSAIGPYKKSVEHERTGLLVYSNSSEEWVQNIIRLIEDEDLRFNIRDNAYNLIESNYTIEKSIKQWMDIFEKNYEYKENIKQKIRNLFDKLYK